MTSARVPAAGVLYEDLIRLMRSIPRPPSVRFVASPAGARLLDALGAVAGRPSAAVRDGQLVMGYPVVISDYVPAGSVLPLPALTFGALSVEWGLGTAEYFGAVRAVPPWDRADVARWFNVPARLLRHGRGGRRLMGEAVDPKRDQRAPNGKGGQVIRVLESGGLVLSSGRRIDPVCGVGLSWGRAK